jgi:hypothetical protein
LREEEQRLTTRGTERSLEVAPGGLAFASRNPHAARRVTERTGRILIMASPAGFESFFIELAEGEREGTIGADAYARVSAKYAITWL